jgi:polysaccharide biosynthesis/export protein
VNARSFLIALTLGIAAAVSAGGPARASTMPYTIHAGDQLLVSVYGEQALTQTVTVLPDGNVELPLVGRMHFAGNTPEAASRVLVRALKQYIRKPLVTIEIATQGQIGTLVLGDVKTPGKYALRANAKVSDAIAAAGGLDPTIVGDLPMARVQVDGNPVQTVSLQKLMHDGDETQDLTLVDGSVVYVQSRATFAIELVGAVDHPGDMQMHEGDRLSAAIAKAGNSANAQADLSHVFISRTGPDGKEFTQQIDLYQSLEHGNLAADPKLQNGDVVYIPQAKKPGTGGFGGVFSVLRLIFGI